MANKGYQMSDTGVEYGDKGWHPITGCRHLCPHECWARKRVELSGKALYPNGFEPTYRPERLMAILTKYPKTQSKNEHLALGELMVLANFMGDMFGEWVPHDWIQDCMAHINISNHQALLLTKSPMRLFNFAMEEEGTMPYNAWYGVTVETQADVERLRIVEDCTEKHRHLRWVSFEPLAGAIDPACITDSLDWVVIGACTGENALPFSDKWAVPLVEKCIELEIPVFLKPNIEPMIHLALSNRMREGWKRAGTWQFPKPKGLGLDRRIAEGQIREALL